MSDRKPKVKSIIMFSNGNMAVCDEHGEQIPELQIPLYQLFAKHAESLGYDLDGASLDDGPYHFKLRKNKDGSWGRQFG